MTPQAQLCYRAAASNYVENQWDKSFRDEDCSKNAPNCIYTYGVQKQQDYYEAIREHVNPQHVVALDLPVLSYFLGSVWMDNGGLFLPNTPPSSWPAYGWKNGGTAR